MGCDIHLYVERRVDGKWVSVDKWTDEKDQDDGGATVVRKRIDYKDRFYSGRNYNLFSILADVRNGRGVAGVKTGEGFVPIADPRGVPGDCDQLIADEAAEWGVDGHSQSYHTLRDLLDFDWTQRTKLQGYVDSASWAKWSRYDRAHGAGPDFYCGGVSGPNIRHVSPQEMDRLLEPVSKVYNAEREEYAKKNLPDTFALAEWGVSYSDAAGSFFTDTIPRLLALAGGTKGLDDVRIVFWFDN